MQRYNNKRLLKYFSSLFHVIRMRLERMTVCLEGRCSIQLSYRTILPIVVPVIARNDAYIDNGYRLRLCKGRHFLRHVQVCGISFSQQMYAECARNIVILHPNYILTP